MAKVEMRTSGDRWTVQQQQQQNNNDVGGDNENNNNNANNANNGNINKRKRTFMTGSNSNVGISSSQQEQVDLRSSGSNKKRPLTPLNARPVDNAEAVAAGRELSITMLADSLPQLVWITRMDGYHEYFNQRWWDYTGLNPDDAAVAEGGGWVVPLHPDDYERSVQKWKIALVTAEPYEIEYRFKRASDGQYRWFLGRAMPWKDSKGDVVKWFGTCTDIHDQKLANEALMKVKQEMEKAAKVCIFFFPSLNVFFFVLVKNVKLDI